MYVEIHPEVPIFTDQLYIGITADRTWISFKIQGSSVVAVVSGTKPAIAEIGQQLAWLGAALRAAPSDHRMAYSTPKIAHNTGPMPSFNLSCRFAEVENFRPGVKPNGSCWRPLFRNSVIVQGYPILARFNHEKGLEIPLHLMVALGRAYRGADSIGGLVVKELSTMFCLTQRIKNSLLWHFVSSHDRKEMSYFSAESLHTGRDYSNHDVDTACLGRSRNFLGWASSVELQAGMVKGVKIHII